MDVTQPTSRRAGLERRPESVADTVGGGTRQAMTASSSALLALARALARQAAQETSAVSTTSFPMTLTQDAAQ